MKFRLNTVCTFRIVFVLLNSYQLIYNLQYLLRLQISNTTSYADS